VTRKNRSVNAVSTTGSRINARYIVFDITSTRFDLVEPMCDCDSHCVFSVRRIVVGRQSAPTTGGARGARFVISFFVSEPLTLLSVFCVTFLRPCPGVI
jgi:hypothetical protein